MNEKIHLLFTVCEEGPKNSLKIYFLAKILSSVPDITEFNKIIERKISQETILLPIGCPNSRRIKEKSEELIEEAVPNGEVSASFDVNNSSLKNKQTKVIVFGLKKAVDRLKTELLNIIVRYTLITFKLNSLDAYQVMINFLSRSCHLKFFFIFI